MYFAGCPGNFSGAAFLHIKNMLFTLRVTFTNAQLEILYATGTNLVIAKAGVGGLLPNVAWQVVKPFNVNEITWEDAYGIYISATPVEGGNVLLQNSTVTIPVAEGKSYTLMDSGVITGPYTGGVPAAFSLLNQYSSRPYMTGGLYQSATVNNMSALSNCVAAAPLLFQHSLIFTPVLAVCIWLQSGVKSNTVVTTITSPVTPLLFGKSIVTIAVAYDSATGKFVAAGKSKRQVSVGEAMGPYL